MKLYADSSSRFARQLVADVLFLCWVIAWVWIGNVVHDGTMQLAGPGDQTTQSATGLAESMTEAGDFLSGLPVVGDGAATPFDKAAGASRALADAGQAEVRAVEKLAFWLGLSIAVIPILVVAGRYLPGRVRFVRDATAAQRFVDGPADLELFALRAMTHQPLHVIARVTDDPVAALRRGDTDVIARLAGIEMADSGLRPPTVGMRTARA
ncbi:hypothetical protein H5V45_00940 [Nocardioides sp. KIGAM211]|uniref:Uncharacterized protein n=1 Tax=Nocardioides luti TaxID=2761101 RepID=A0A7X0VA93_9ACTN|nr:hypothetical protein [Nocardioides luti]MBB6625873.1 hypothetical protein [Nocardioides luti]